MNSNCRAKSGRTSYMNKLVKYITVDIYDSCRKNTRQLPEHLVEIQGSSNRLLKNIATYEWKVGKLALSKEYLFTIVIENTLTYD